MTTKTTTANVAANIEPVGAERDLLRWLGMTMALLGMMISAYLSYVKLADKEAICTNTGAIDCFGVQNSAYSEFLGIPIAVLGLGAYLTIFGLLWLENSVELLIDYGQIMLFSITLFGVVYSGYLTYIEGFVLEKWCLWCVASALLMVGLCGVATTRFIRSLTDMDADEET